MSTTLLPAPDRVATPGPSPAQTSRRDGRGVADPTSGAILWQWTPATLMDLVTGARTLS